MPPSLELFPRDEWVNEFDRRLPSAMQCMQAPAQGCTCTPFLCKIITWNTGPVLANLFAFMYHPKRKCRHFSIVNKRTFHQRKVTILRGATPGPSSLLLLIWYFTRTGCNNSSVAIAMLQIKIIIYARWAGAVSEVKQWRREDKYIWQFGQIQQSNGGAGCQEEGWGGFAL